VLPCAPSALCYSFLNVPGWTVSGQVATGKLGGIVFPGGVPDGTNIVGCGNEVGTGSISQTLSATLQPNTTYTLVVSVGRRADFPFGGYNVELLAGPTTLASDSSLSPPAGGFLADRIVYSSGANPSLQGQKLTIRLTGNVVGAQAVFDKVSLDATPTVISSSLVQIASGGGWKTTITLVNVSALPISVTLAFWVDNGQPLSLPYTVFQSGRSTSGTGSSLGRTINPGTRVLIETEAPALGPILVGWGEVTSVGPIDGYAIFRQRSQSGDSEGTASLSSGNSSSIVLPYDNTTGFATGVALINSTTDGIIIRATIRDDDGLQIGLDAIVLPAKGHTSFFVGDRFPVTSGRGGIIELQSTTGGGIAGVGLRFSASGTFTSVPVIVRQ